MTVSEAQYQDWAADLSDLDQQIEDLQDAKRDFYKSVREEHGKVTADSLKLAVKLNRMDSEKRAAAEEVDTEALRILAIIQKPRAPRATRVEIVEQFDAETGEITETPATVAGQAAPEGTRRMASSVENGAAEISTTIQPETANEAGDELVTPLPVAADHGQVEADAETLPAGGGNVAIASAHIVAGEGAHNASVTTFTPKPLRPHCLNPQLCGGQGRQHCWKCLKALEQSGAA